MPCATSAPCASRGSSPNPSPPINWRRPSPSPARVRRAGPARSAVRSEPPTRAPTVAPRGLRRSNWTKLPRLFRTPVHFRRFHELHRQRRLRHPHDVYRLRRPRALRASGGAGGPHENQRAPFERRHAVYEQLVAGGRHHSHTGDHHHVLGEIHRRRRRLGGGAPGLAPGSPPLDRISHHLPYRLWRSLECRVKDSDQRVRRHPRPTTFVVAGCMSTCTDPQRDDRNPNKRIHHSPLCPLCLCGEFVFMSGYTPPPVLPPTW